MHNYRATVQRLPIVNITRIGAALGRTDDGSAQAPIRAAGFLRGTRIGTPAGEVAVEALRVGHEVLTVDGRICPIRRIGERRATAVQAATERGLRPIRITAGALGRLRPRRDLLLSACHALLLTDPQGGARVLVPAALLVNGRTIIHDPAGGDITFFHIELDGHDAILAEGQPAETFSEQDSRDGFDNAADRAAHYPPGVGTFVPFQAPRIEDGPVLARIRAGLDQRNRATTGPLDGYLDRVTAGRVEGWAQDLGCPEGPVLLEIVVDGGVAGAVLANRFRADLLEPYGGYCAFTFDMPQGTTIARDSHVVVRRAADGMALPRTGTSMENDQAGLGLALPGT